MFYPLNYGAIFPFSGCKGRKKVKSDQRKVKKVKSVLDAENIHYTSGKTLVPFRLSGNVEWGVPFPECENLKDLTFWVWPESLWAPISFTLAYLREKEKEDDLSKWWYDDESEVYQFIGEDNIYFYAIAQTALVRADGAVELAAVADVGMVVAVVVHPNDAEGEHTLRLDHAVEQVGFFIFGVGIHHGGDRGEYFLYGLHEFRLVAVLFLDVLNNALDIRIHGKFISFL